MGIAGGVRNLPWLFTATFVTLIVAQPLYGTLVAKLPRARFIPWSITSSSRTLRCSGCC
jgi:AAA family ATP:ADP antiporter